MRTAQESLKTGKKNYFAGMKTLTGYIRSFLSDSDKSTLFFTSIFCGAIIFINYQFGLETGIQKKLSVPFKLIAWYAVFLAALGLPLLIGLRNTTQRPFSPLFFGTVFLAPFLFACKYVLRVPLSVTGDPVLNQAWNKILYWPLLLAALLLVLYLLNRFFYHDRSFFGLRNRLKNADWYWLLLVLMIPLVLLAATQPDFQAVYPKLKMLTPGESLSGIPVWQAFLFELSYGSDFLGIELFFRGFLVLTLSRWLGREAILPIAVFYCSIHFGKPLGECISSYFGGIILGVIVYHTRSIRGGLLVHLGIAWLMEIAGML